MKTQYATPNHPKPCWQSMAILFVLFMSAFLLDRAYVGPLAEFTLNEPALDFQRSKPFAMPTEIRHAHSVHIAFDGLARDDTNHGNFFQTSDSPLAIRVEIQHPNQLWLALDDMASAVLSKNFTLNRWHHFELTAEQGKFLAVSLDGRQVYYTARADLTHLGSYRFDQIVIGSGQAGKSPVSGAIKNWNSVIRYSPALPLFYHLLSLAAMGLLVYLTLRATRCINTGEENQGATFPLCRDFIFIAGGYVLLALALWLNLGGHALEKWNLAVALGLAFLLLPLLAYSTEHSGTMRWLWWASALILGIPLGRVLLPLMITQQGFETHAIESVIGIVMFAVSAAAIFSCETNIPFARLRLLGFLLLGLLACIAVAPLQNWIQVSKSLADQPAQTVFLLTLTASLVTAFSWQLATCRETPCRGRACYGLFNVIPYLVFYLFAFRADTLFIDGSPMHWEYFVGPIRTLREGAWPLWDAPSQYGFLNVIIPAALPIRNSWNAFYAFQGCVLLLAAGLYYRGLQHWLVTNKLITCAIVVGTFFLAYPPLIGPQPFPSSSAVRFLWCYVMLYWAVVSFLGPDPSLRRYVRKGAILWVLAVLWSAESAIYATAIFMAPIGWQLLLDLLHRQWKNAAANAAHWMGIPVLALSIVLAFIAGYYRARLGHWPDIGMFFMYSTAYSGGFGAIPITSGGMIWFYGLLIFTGGCGLYAVTVKQGTTEGPAGAIIAAMGCVFVISTYYIGRAVTNNVIAEYPILCFSLAIMLRATALGDRTRMSQIALALPVFVLGLMSPFWNTALIEVVRGIHLLPQTMESRIGRPDAELAVLLKQAHITIDSPVTYYGNDAKMPAMLVDNTLRSFEKTWLPNPLQILEEPIPNERRSKIMDRYLQHAEAGYFIQKRGEAEDRVTEWFALLKPVYVAQQSWTSPHYRIIHFVPRKR